jgi:hypothetical protein
MELKDSFGQTSVLTFKDGKNPALNATQRNSSCRRARTYSIIDARESCRHDASPMRHGGFLSDHGRSFSTEPRQPLAEALRPDARRSDRPAHLLGPGKPLRLAFESGSRIR